MVLGAGLGDRAARREIGYLPELFRYQPWLRAREVVDLHARLRAVDDGAPPVDARAALETVGLADRADDLVQECLERAIRKRSLFRPTGPLQAWLFRIAHNHCLNALKGRRREIPVGAHTKDLSNPHRFVNVQDPSLSVSERLEQRELQAVIQEKLNELTPDHRAVIVLRDIQGLSYDEIASALDIEGGTVRSRLHRARAELKEKLRAYLET